MNQRIQIRKGFAPSMAVAAIITAVVFSCTPPLLYYILEKTGFEPWAVPLISLGLGVVLGAFLFKFPVSIVTRMENQANELLTDLEGVNQELLDGRDRLNQTQQELVESNQRILKELQLASTIQSSLFPINLPDVPGVTLAATAVAANEVGGDYIDLFVTKHNKLGVAIGDVMGKGVPAALFVAMTYAFVRNYAMEMDSPGALVDRINWGLFPQLELTEQFITLFYSIYDPDKRELVYTNAGHNPPIVYRAGTGECETLEIRDYFMGGRADAQYREGTVALNQGDIVFFYTDGLKEGRNKEKEQFGLGRIVRLIKENHMHDPASIQEIISYEFTEFLAGEPPYDDVTMTVIKINE